MPPELSVIIVSYNTADHLARCLPSVLSQADVSFEVFVVDNASQDESVELVRQQFPEVKLIANTDNLGFARANNQAIRQAQGRYLYFLNPDTEVKPGCFAAAIGFMEQHRGIGMAGTCILNPDGSLQSSVETRYPGERHTRGELANLPGEIAWLLGASLIAKREAIAAAGGGFDEDYFLYGEDLDLCLTLRQRGWRLGYIPEAVIVHWEGQSERKSVPAAVWQKKLSAELLFYQKHYRAETIQAIRRANRLQARWRIATLSLALPFLADKTAARQKLARYKTVLKVFS